MDPEFGHLIDSTAFTLGIVENLAEPRLALQERYAIDPQPPESMTQTKIFVDYMSATREAATPVDPATDRPEIVAEKDWQTKEISAAYTWQQTPLDNHRVVARRAPGEPIGGTGYSIMQRRMMCEVMAVEHLMKRNAILKEIWVANLLLAGQYTIDYRDGEPRLVDMGRASEMTIDLTGSDRWMVDGSSPSGVLRQVEDAMSRNGGGGAEEILFDPLGFEDFISNESVKEQLDQRHLMDIGMRGGPGRSKRGIFEMGYWNGYNILVHRDHYRANDADAKFIPDYTALVIAREDMRMTAAWGPLLNAHYPDGGTMLPYGARSFLPRKGNKRFVEVESAPLVYLKRANSVGRINLRG